LQYLNDGASGHFSKFTMREGWLLAVSF
jgi:hypothetical protein